MVVQLSPLCLLLINVSGFRIPVHQSSFKCSEFTFGLPVDGERCRSAYLSSKAGNFPNAHHFPELVAQSSRKIRVKTVSHKKWHHQLAMSRVEKPHRPKSLKTYPWSCLFNHVSQEFLQREQTITNVGPGVKGSFSWLDTLARLRKRILGWSSNSL